MPVSLASYRPSGDCESTVLTPKREHAVTDHRLVALEQMFRRLSYRGKFGAADREAILNLPCHTKLLERHGYIVREREEVTQTCILLSGFAIRHKIVLDGARQIVAVHMNGDLVDLENSLLGVADHNVQVLTDSHVAYIPTCAIKKLAFEYPNVGTALWLQTLIDGSVYREWIANVGRRDARARIAHLFCELSLRLKIAGLGEATKYELPLTQEQIADCTGLTPVHVNRTMKTLEAEALIQRQGIRSMTIGDWKKLAQAGDFDSTYLHLHEDEPALT